MMPAPPLDPLALALRLGASFEATGVPYAIGGALAYGLWGIPRATVDIDMNVFVDGPDLEGVYRALEGLGVAVDRARAAAAAAREGMFEVWSNSYRIDLFVPSTEFAAEAERTRVRKQIEGVAAWFLSAEALAVFKLLFFRAKDLVDLERLVGVQQERLDAAYVRSWIVRLMGQDDERLPRWDAIVRSAKS